MSSTCKYATYRLSRHFGLAFVVYITYLLFNEDQAKEQESKAIVPLDSFI